MILTVNNSRSGCEKSDTENLSHICWEEDADMSAMCPKDLASWKWEGDAGVAKGGTPFITRYTVGSSGGTIYFLTKDGNQCQDDGDARYTAAVTTVSGMPTGLNADISCSPESNSPNEVILCPL